MCVYCNGTELKDSFTTYIAVMNKFTIIIKNVPCQECIQCGEKYYTNEVMQAIEAIVKKTSISRANSMSLSTVLLPDSELWFNLHTPTW